MCVAQPPVAGVQLGERGEVAVNAVLASLRITLQLTVGSADHGEGGREHIHPEV